MTSPTKRAGRTLHESGYPTPPHPQPPSNPIALNSNRKEEPHATH